MVIHLWVSQWKEFQDYWLRYTFSKKRTDFFKPIPGIIPILYWVITSSMCMYCMYTCTEFYVTSICAFVILHKATMGTDFTDWQPRPRPRQVHISDIFHFNMCTESNTMWEDTREVSQWSPFHHHIHFHLICTFFKYKKKGQCLGKTMLENMYNTVMVYCRGVPFVSISRFEIKLRYFDSKYCFWVKCRVS